MTVIEDHYFLLPLFKECPFRILIMYTKNDYMAVGEIHNAFWLVSKVDHQMIKA